MWIRDWSDFVCFTVQEVEGGSRNGPGSGGSGSGGHHHCPVVRPIAVRWQQEIAGIMMISVPPSSCWFAGRPALWALLYLVGNAIGRLMIILAGAVPGQHTRYGLKLVLSWSAVAMVTVLVVDQVLPGTIVRVSENIFSVRDTEIREDLVKPHVSERSGGPGSPNTWEELGAYGTRFTGLGLYKDELEELTGRPSREPIRVYAGLNNGDTDRDRALNVVSELERTGAADREALMIAPTTGTGWVNPTAAQAFELMFDGDTAIAADQYSYLPSAIQFISTAIRCNAARSWSPRWSMVAYLPEDDAKIRLR